MRPSALSTAIRRVDGCPTVTHMRYGYTNNHNQTEKETSRRRRKEKKEEEKEKKEEEKKAKEQECTVKGQCPIDGSSLMPQYDSDAPHMAAAPPASAKRMLLHVFLHGTSAAPAHYLGWLRASRAAGFHTIGLSYASSPFADAAVSDFCNCSAEKAVPCLSSYHHSALFGGNATPWQSVKGDSIMARVDALLLQLQALFPAEGWESFRWNGEVAWAASVWSGHSQGGSHVAHLVKVRQVFRAVLLSAPQDAFFLAEPSGKAVVATPWHAIYGFVHLAEDHSDIILRNWRLMALHGHASVAKVQPDLARMMSGGALHVEKDPHLGVAGHRLFGTSGKPNATCGCKARSHHCSTARDGCELHDAERGAFWGRLLDADVLAVNAGVPFKQSAAGYFCGGTDGKQTLTSLAARQSVQGCANAVSTDTQCTETFYYIVHGVVGLCVCILRGGTCQKAAVPGDFTGAIYEIQAQQVAPVEEEFPDGGLSARFWVALFIVVVTLGFMFAFCVHGCWTFTPEHIDSQARAVPTSPTGYDEFDAGYERPAVYGKGQG